MPPRKTRYRVLVGLNYGPDDQRAEPGEVVHDLPASAVKDLLALRAIERVTTRKPAK